MARATTGKYWESASDIQKKKYKDLLVRKIINSIDLHLKNIKKTNFKISKIVKRGKKLIYVRGFFMNSGKKIDITWKLYSKNFLILDLEVEKFH